MFFISDGAGWLADLPADWIAPTAIQLDQFHGKLRISEVARDPERAARWWAWVTEHNLGALGRSIESLTRSGAIDPEAGRVLFGYLAEGTDAFHTYLRLQEQGHSPQMATKQIALMLAAGRQAAGAEERTPVGIIRDAVTSYGKRDEANFAGTIAEMDDVFNITGTGQQRRVKVNRTGYEEAGELAKTLTGSGA